MPTFARPRPTRRRTRPRWAPLLVAVFGAWIAAPRAAAAQTSGAQNPQGGQNAQGTQERAPGVRTMTLAEALSFAREHHPRLVAAEARIQASRAAAEVPRAQWLPYLGATAQVFGGTANNTSTVYLNTDVLDLPRIGGTTSRNASTAGWSPYLSTLVGVGARQEIYDFGRIAAQSAAADAAVDVERHRSDNAWLNVELGVRESYYAVFAARGVLRAAEDAVRRASVHRDMARAWVEQGMRPRIELERAEADLARFDVGRIRAQGGVDAAQAQFAATVGLTAARLDVAGEAPPTAPLPSLADAMREAGARDPLVLETLARLRAQEAQTHAIAAEMRPDISLTGTITGRAGGAPPSGAGDTANFGGAAPSVPNWDVGVVLNWPLFDGVVLARRRASERAEQAVRAEVGAVRQAQVGAIQEAWVAVNVAQAALPALERALAAAEANYAQADARFRSGLGTSVELADAEALRTDADIQLAAGRFQVARARAQFARVVAEGQ